MLQDTEDDKILRLFSDSASREEGFGLLINKYQQHVYWVVRRMVTDHDDSNDIVQDTFVKIWQNLGGFRGESKLYTWIYRIAANESLAFLKRSKKKDHMTWEHFENTAAAGMKADPYFDGDEIQQRFHSAIQKLPPQQKLIFNMRYFDEMKYEEISAVLNLTEGSLKASYHHAVKKIEKFITGD